MMTTSQSLLERLKGPGDSGCWAQLSEIYQPLIRDWLRRLSAPSSEVDDLVQEVLIVVMRKLPGFEHNRRPGAFRAWLRYITVNCLRDLWKSRRFRPAASGGDDFQKVLDELADPASPLAAQWDQEHDQAVVTALLRRIRVDFDEQSCRVFDMLTLGEMSAGEVGQAVGLKRNAVYAIRSRIMSRLREEAQGILE